MANPVNLEKIVAEVRGSERIQQTRKIQHHPGQKRFDQELAQQKQKQEDISQEDEVVIGNKKRQQKELTPETEAPTPVQRSDKTKSGPLGTHIDVTV